MVEAGSLPCVAAGAGDGEVGQVVAAAMVLGMDVLDGAPEWARRGQGHHDGSLAMDALADEGIGPVDDSALEGRVGGGGPDQKGMGAALHSSTLGARAATAAGRAK
jgi:hypothetical protein